MTKRRALFTLLSLLAVAGLAGCGSTPPRTSIAAGKPVLTVSASSPLAPLAWLAGTWRQDTSPDEFVEEIWSSPSDDAMVGMGRVVHRGRTVFHEFLLLEAKEGTLVYTAHLDGQPPTPFRLLKYDAARSEWVFANPAHDCPTHILYRKEPNGSLFAHVEGPKVPTCSASSFTMFRVP